jgi:hypothetical protein
MRRWLSPPDPSSNYQRALKLHQEGTGVWYLENKEHTTWKTSSSTFHWLHGIPGCGKTILSSTILKSVLELCTNDPGRAVAYFYFDFKDTEKQDPDPMIRSFIMQLLSQCIKIPSTLEMLFSTCENGRRQPSTSALLDVLEEIIGQFPHVYIILDALDECTTRTELLSILESIIGWQLKGLHLLVTSRKEQDIESSLECLIEECDIICIQSKLVDQDIRKYVHQRLSTDKDLKKWQKDPDVMHEIVTALMKGAQGMQVFPLSCSGT